MLIFLLFENLRIPASSLLGEEDEGLRRIMDSLTPSASS